MDDAVIGILAGGSATRLGALGQHTNKALMTPGQRPVLVHQLLQLYKAGYSEAAITVSPRWREQVLEVVRTSIGQLMKLTVIVEEVPLGPGPGVAALADFANGRPLVLLLADTWLKEWPQTAHEDWVAMAPAPESRVWCCQAITGYKEAHAPEGTPVAIGVYRFEDSEWLAECAVRAHIDDHRTLGHLLSSYHEGRSLQNIMVDGWVDVGTLASLESSASIWITGRPRNTFEIVPNGFIHKSGEGESFLQERDYVLRLDPSRSVLFPRVLDNGPSGYLTEYIELPTLAQLFLYWSCPADEWGRRVGSILSVLEKTLWPIATESSAEASSWAREIYIQKLRNRFASWKDPLAEEGILKINGEHYLAGQELIERLCDRLETICLDARPGFIHGDLNFHNILYSERSGVFRLIDPRGSNQKLEYCRDIQYDLAKLRYSYHGHFAAICEELYELTGEKDEWQVRWIERLDYSATKSAIDHAVSRYSSLANLAAIEASILLSAPPLHADSTSQQRALYLSGVILASKVLNEKVLVD